MPKRSAPRPNPVAKGKPVVSYPTPNISDSIYVEVVDAQQGKYEPLIYGTAFNDVEHSAFPDALPDHILVFDDMADASGATRKRVWVNNRIDQDAYNYEVDYTNGTAYPEYIRAYVIPRATYTPIAIGTADPVDAGAFLISEKVLNAAEPRELNSQYVKVVRQYRTLPGPMTVKEISYPYGGIKTSPRVVVHQEVIAPTYSPNDPGAVCPIAGYGTAILVSQAFKETENPAIKQYLGVYDVVPSSATQQGYGFSISYPYGGLVANPRVTWNFQIAKSSYSAAAPGSACPISGYTAAVLIAETTKGTEEQDQLITVTRIYDTIPTATQQQGFGYSVSYPYGGQTAYPRVTWEFAIAIGSYSAAAPGSACPISAYSTAVLVSEVMKGAADQNQIVHVTRTFDIIPAAANQQGYGYSVGYFNGDKDYPLLTWKFQMALSSYAPAADLSACPITGYTGLLVVDQQMDGNNEQPQFVSVTRKYETLPGPLVHKIDYDNNQLTYPIVTTSQRVAVSSYNAGTEGSATCIIVGYTTLVLFEQHMNSTDYVNVKEDLRIYEKTPNNIITSRDFDAELNLIATTTRQKIVSGATPSPSNLTLELREQPLDKFRTLQIITTIASLPADKIEYKTGQWPFPPLLYSLSVQSRRIGDIYYYTGTAYNQRPRYECFVLPGWYRNIQNVSALFRITTSFHQAGSLPSISIYTCPTRDIFYNGITFQLDFRGVLCDAINPNISFAGVGDGKYGDVVESFSITATSPSAATYNSQIGQWKIIGVDQERYSGTIWVQQKTEVQLQ